MNLLRGKIRVFALPFLLLFAAIPAFSQTGAITGKATDGTGGLIPGVEVSINSPAMIGGVRTAPTDETGGYRFTLLPPGLYRVTFALPGFKTLNVDGVQVDAGATMTINGKMEVASGEPGQYPPTARFKIRKNFPASNGHTAPRGRLNGVYVTYTFLGSST